MVIIGHLSWEQASAPSRTHPAEIAIQVLAAVQVLAAYLSIWKYASRKVLALAIPGAGLIWGMGAFVAGDCAVTGNWL